MSDDMVATPRRKRRLVGVAIVLLLLAILTLIGLAYIKQGEVESTRDYFARHQSSVEYPLYYPSELLSYYFVDKGSFTNSGGTVIFTIVRNDGAKIVVTEQALPADFSLEGISGLHHEIPNIGTVVVGEGFQGLRAVLKTGKTLVLLATTNKVSTADLQAIAYNLRPAR